MREYQYWCKIYIDFSVFFVSKFGVGFMKCYKCGNEIEQNSMLCSHCGARVNALSANNDSWDEFDSLFNEEKPEDNDLFEKELFSNDFDPLSPLAGEKYGYSFETQDDSDSENGGGARKIILVVLITVFALIILFTFFNIIVFKATPDNVLTDYKIAISKIIGEQYAPKNAVNNGAYSAVNQGDTNYNGGSYSNSDSNGYNYDEFTTDYANAASQVNNTGDITSSFSAEEIRLLNLFLSNFAEAGVKDVSSSDNSGMTNFVITQAIINSPKIITNLGSELFLAGGVRYNRTISADYVTERRERYFGVRGSDYSTDRFRYEDGDYYIPDDVANVSSYFSKLDRAVTNTDGTITAYFTSYDCRGLAANENIYKGTGTANIGNSRKVGGGEAILERRYLGPKYANFIVKNYKLTSGRDYEYRNTLVTSYQTNNDSAYGASSDSIPSELIRYENGLREEGRTYKISLQDDSWNINYRSSPEIKKSGEAGYNVLGQIQSGSEIYVEYIYDGTWAVFRKDGRYVFASIYAGNDSSQNKLMYPV